MLTIPISITALSSLSPLGDHPQEVWSNYCNNHHFIKEIPIKNHPTFAATLSQNQLQAIEAMKSAQPKYKPLDPSVLYALYVSRKAVKLAGWTKKDSFGINIGSSRGATTLFEAHHEAFLKNGKTEPLASPTTTLGNISSWVAHDLQQEGPESSHSITCTTSLHALLNGAAWLQAGWADKFLVGGSEAPLTPFTIAQMQALKIYAKTKNHYPCRALDIEKTANTMVLGEGAAVACLEKGRSPHALAKLEGVGYATETLQHNASLSANGECLQKAMRMALQQTPLAQVDAVVLHAPGTLKGDAAEVDAIRQVFGEQLPVLTTNKWKIGHTLGASGLFSLELAVLMLQRQRFIPVPFIPMQVAPAKLNTILVNAVGFGGNAVSVLLSKP